MEKRTDPWKHIESLIHTEKEEALHDFRHAGDLLIPKKEHSPSPYMLVMANAALFFLAVALMVIWSFWSFKRIRPTHPPLSAFLMEMPRFRTTCQLVGPAKPFPEADTSFIHLLEIITTHSQNSASAEMNLIQKAPTAIEHVDSASVQRKIKTVIGESRLECLITRLYHSSKEV